MTMAVGVVSYLNLRVPIQIQRPKGSDWFEVVSSNSIPLLISGRGTDDDARRAAEAALKTLADVLLHQLDPEDWASYLAENRAGFEVRFRQSAADEVKVEAIAE